MSEMENQKRLAVPGIEIETNSTLKAAHTPGPWTVQRNARLEIVSLIEPFADCNWYQGVAHVYRAGKMNGAPYRMPAQANAHLIAASPDLLEAAKAALEVFDGTVSLNHSAPIAIQLREAISKAEGR